MITGRPDWDALLADVDLFDPDEPVLIIRSRDICSAGAARDYAERLRLTGADPAMVDAVMRHAAKMELWPIKRVPTLPMTDGQERHAAYVEKRRLYRERHPPVPRSVIAALDAQVAAAAEQPEQNDDQKH